MKFNFNNFMLFLSIMQTEVVRHYFMIYGPSLKTGRILLFNFLKLFIIKHYLHSFSKKKNIILTPPLCTISDK